MNQRHAELLAQLLLCRVPSSVVDEVASNFLMVEELSVKLEYIETQRQITSSDRDNRRRRMDIALAVLDESALNDLDQIASFLWPYPIANKFEEIPDRVPRPEFGSSGDSDPTQVPTISQPDAV